MTAQIEKRKYNTYCRDCGRLDERETEGQCRKCSGLKRVRIPESISTPSVKLIRDMK